MENLQIRNRRVIKLDHSPKENLNEIYVDDTIYCFISNFCQLNICDTAGENTVVTIPEGLLEDVEIIYLSYLTIWRVVFIATDSMLITYDIAKASFSWIEPVTDGKLIHASWNPTQTFLVTIDDLGELSEYLFKEIPGIPYYHHEFILTIQGALEENVPNSVYVGWGTKNAQFKGSNKNRKEVAEIPQKYSYPIISWRGNGEMFVVNYWKNSRRFLKVFDSNLRAQFESKPYNNLLTATSFKDQGNFIACAATDGETNKIVIFEKNCLVKSTFVIPENKGEIKNIQYHREKNILAVHSQSSLESCLNIYLYANNTWYLKQQLYFPLDGPENILKFHWVNDLSAGACRLNVLTTRAIHMYEFTVETYGVIHDLVAVINGSKVLFTEFSQEIVPPPGASKSLFFERPVNQLSFYPNNVYQFTLSDGSSVYYRYEDGNFIKYDVGALLEGIQVNNNSMSSYEVVIEGTTHLITLNDELELIIDEKVMINNVSSLHVHGKYLLFTRTNFDSYKLYSVRLIKEMILEFNPERFFSRDVEQGAKIICVTDKDQIILTMPRGNLETITCRLIAIDTIERFLLENQWCNAINQIRSQKLNWNLLIDLNKHRFVACMKEFIEAANTVSLLNTIVTEFGTENCLQTMYKAWYKQESQMDQYSFHTVIDEGPKIDILSAILEMLTRLNPTSNLLIIITIQIKHFSVKAALKSVLQVFELNDLETCKKAVSQIIRYKHAGDVISATYSLYNVRFLSFIYASCSEDPRVFIPEIEELETLSPMSLRFVMSLRGREYEEATKYLIRMRDKDEVFVASFITKYSTQAVAYNNVRPGDLHFQLITKHYAEHLAYKGRHNEAGLVLERAGLYEEALVRYKAVRNWQKVISLMNMIKMQDEYKIQTLRSLAQDLISHKQIEEAAFIYEHYCDDFKSAFEALVEHNMFQKAVCLARQYGSKELIESTVQPKLKSHMEDLHEKISELGQQFDVYTTRLLLLREKKYEQLLRKMIPPDDSVEMENDRTEIESDTNSEYSSIISSSSASSVTSGSSRSSSMSSRNRRKLEKKKTDLREGGRFENIALIRQLYLLLLDIFAIGDEVSKACQSVVDEDGFKYAKVLHCTLEIVQCKAEADIPRIWSHTFLHAESSSQADVLAVIENRDELDEQFRTPPPPELLKKNWKLLLFN